LSLKYRLGLRRSLHSGSWRALGSPTLRITPCYFGEAVYFFLTTYLRVLR
jgi:hypothetical protein